MRLLLNLGLIGVSTFAIACGSDIPLGPDIVSCDCDCVTTTANTLTAGACSQNFNACDPACGDMTCTATGGCRTQCLNTPASPNQTHDTATLAICVDSTVPGRIGQACEKRCNDYGAGSATKCLSAVLIAAGLDLNKLPSSLRDLVSIYPNEAQSLADIAMQTCGLWVFDKLTGTCGYHASGPQALLDLLSCFVSPWYLMGLAGDNGSSSAIRACSLQKAEVYTVNGCPEYKRENPDQANVGGVPSPAKEQIGQDSSAIISGASIEAKTVRLAGSASSNRVGPILILSQLQMVMSSTTLNIDGDDVEMSNGLLMLDAPVAAVLNPDNTFSIGANQLKTIVTAVVGGKTDSVSAINPAPVTGHYQETSGEFSLVGQFHLQQLDADLSVHLNLEFTNRPPILDAGPDRTIECEEQTREGVVPLSAATAFDPDPGDHIARYTWSADQVQIADGSTVFDAAAHLGLGAHVITLSATDTRESMSRDVALVTIVDTQRPVFAKLPPLINSLCDPEIELTNIPSPSASDACSPTVKVSGEIVEANGQVVTPAIPVLGQAMKLSFGNYVVNWTARDQSGNSATASQQLIVQPGLFASHGATVADRSVVQGTGTTAALASAGPELVQIGVGAQTGTLVGNGSFFLSEHSYVNGNVLASGTVTRQNSVTVTGTVSERVTTAFPKCPDLTGINFPSTATKPVNLEPGERLALTPGSYSSVAVKSRARLTMAAGTYFLTELDLETDSTLELKQPVTIYVKNRIIERGHITTMSGAPEAFYLGYFGTEDFFVQAPFAGGTVVAPQASVVVGSLGSNAFRGQLFAKKIELQADATLTCAATSVSVPKLVQP